MIRAALLTLALLAAPQAWAKVEVMQFDTPEQEATYNKMIDELRCLVCQNQNLADSNAELAVDMRRKTHEMVMQNKSEKEIAAFMVERYGDFVLYRPPLNSNTLLLWAGPFLILLVGVTLLIRTVLSRRAAVEPDVDDARLKAAATLLDERTDKRDA
jgi:cytochrome c-type biogenesis protein CcmH